MPKNGVTIVLPTYNERENIRILIPLIGKELDGKTHYEIIVVDDDSPDGTWREAKKFEDIYNVRVIRRIGKRGLVSAILEGIARARHRYVIVMDADLQHPPEVIGKIHRHLKKCDLVIASRYVEGGGVEGWSPLRLIVSKGATFLAHLFFPKIRIVRDPMSGFFGVNKGILRGVKINALGFKVLLEILVKCRYKSLIEVPYIFRSRKYGSSKLSKGIMIQYVEHLFILFLQTKNIRKLIYVMLLIMLFACGLIIWRL